MEESGVMASQIQDVLFYIIGLLILMSVAIVLFFYFSRRRIMKTELEKANLEIEHQKQVLQSVIITQEEERSRIAQDMHDAISSKLNVVSLNTNMLKDESNTKEERDEIADNIIRITGTVLENSRRIAHDLLPPTLDKFGLEAALEELCEEVSATGRFKIRQSFKYPLQTLKAEDELHLFRITQELFNNAIKYSEAKEISLSVDVLSDFLQFRYADDGIGFDLEKAKKAKGLGLSGIENRTSILNGSIVISSAPGEGLQVEITKQLT